MVAIEMNKRAEDWEKRQDKQINKLKWTLHVHLKRNGDKKRIKMKEMYVGRGKERWERRGKQGSRKGKGPRKKISERQDAVEG